MKQQRIDWFFLCLICVGFLGACSTEEAPMMHEDHETITRGVAVLHPVGNSGVSGIVTFTQTGNSVDIDARILGLTPGDHGFHIHEFGDCAALDATSAGGHFNPGGHEHGAPSDSVRHVGDLGNITADDAGLGTYEALDSFISFSGPNSIIGRAVIVHAGADDLTSQPTGAAGGRIACGVIGIAQGGIAQQ